MNSTMESRELFLFIKNLKAPVIVSNIDDSLEPDIQNTYQKSVVVERNGKKIGIIGVIIKTANVSTLHIS
jgi:5'-nucleotidase